MIFVDYGKELSQDENVHYLYLEEVSDSEAALLRHLGYEPLDSNDGRVINNPNLETWVKYEELE